MEFCKHVQNIIDWGKDKRLKEIQDSLDNLLEESRRRTSEAAKSRPPPSDTLQAAGGYKHKASRKGKPKADSGEGKVKASLNSVGDSNGWEWDDEMKANKTWNEGLGTSVYWDKEARAEKY